MEALLDAYRSDIRGVLRAVLVLGAFGIGAALVLAYHLGQAKKAVTSARSRFRASRREAQRLERMIGVQEREILRLDEIRARTELGCRRKDAALTVANRELVEAQDVIASLREYVEQVSRPAPLDLEL